jgi:hypothetical protein
MVLLMRELAHLDAVPDLYVILYQIARGEETLGNLDHLFQALGADHEPIVEGEPDQQDREDQEQVDDPFPPVVRTFSDSGEGYCHQ